MVSSADALVKQIDGVFSGGEQGPQFTPSASQFETFLITSARLSPVTRSVATSGRVSSSPAEGWGQGIEFIEFVELVEFIEFIETGDTVETQ